jgi:hypothetical protein
MEDIQGSAPEAGAEAVVTELPKGETEGQVENGQVAEGQDPEEQKTERQKKREREKANLARLRSEAAEAQARAAEAEKRKQAILEAGKREAPPKEADFPDPIEFAAAKAIWGAEQRLTEREAKNAGEAAEAAKQEAEAIKKRERAVVAQSWTVQVAEAKARYADFDQVALANDLPVTEAMGELIMTSDAGPDVLYHLGQNRALAAQIAAMNPVEAARAIGRIEASLSAPKPRTETKAPDPISPVRGSAGASLNPDKMSYEEYRQARMSGKIR